MEFALPFMIENSVKRSLSFFFPNQQEIAHPIFLLDTKEINNNTKAIKKIQCAWKMYQCFRKFKIRKRKMTHRRFVIDELTKTEINYHSHLDLVVKQVLNYCLDNQILTHIESQIIFSNLLAILALSSDLGCDLKIMFENFDNKKTEVASIFLKYIVNFEIYFEYCRNYKEMQVVMEKFIKKKHPFSQYLNTIENSSTLLHSDLFSFLIKPIQRLPKYVLIFKDLLKNTEQTHPDYDNINMVLKKFLELNTKNNSNMEVYLIKQMKIIELQENFGTPNNLLILNGRREFIQEEVLNMVTYGMPIPVICYFLSDAIIIAKRSNDQCFLSNFFELDNNSFIKDLDNQTYFKYIFNIYGKKGGITLSTDTKEAKKSLIDMLQSEILANLKLKQEINIVILKKLQRLKTYDIIFDKFFNDIRVSVLGVVQRGLKDPYNVYVIEIKIEDFIQKCFLRYSECLKLDEIIKKDYPELIFTHLSKDYWFNSNKIKTIEARKIIIEQFLQSIITNKILMKDGKKILKPLGFPKSFDLFHKDNDFNCEFFDPYSNVDKIILNMEFFSISSILRGSIKTESKIIARKNESNVTNNINSIVQIKLMNDKIIDIPYNNNTKIYEIFNEVVNKVNLNSYLDFKLFLINLNKEEKPLDDDEYVYKILEQEDDELENKSFLKTIFKSKSSTIFTLIFKKYYFLPADIEEKDLRKDRVKLELLAHQIFQESAQFKYKLSIDDYSLLASLQIYLKNQEVLTLDKSYFIKNLKKYIPNTIFPRLKENQWEKTIRNFVLKIDTEIKNIVEKSMKNSFIERFSLLDYDLLIFLTTINFIQKNNMYGSQFFWVHASLENVSKDIKFPHCFWVAINYDSINLIGPEDKNFFLTMKLEKIEKMFATPMCLNLVFEGGKYMFSSSSSFEMCELINDYIKIKRVMPRERRKSYLKMKIKNHYD